MIRQHTPSPWQVRGCELVGEGTLLATIHWHSGRDVENRADTALIVNAPDTLKALIDLSCYLSNTPHHNAPEAAAARKAVLKALTLVDDEPFPQPRRRDGQEPCGECRLPAGETCDICGASA